MADEPAPPPIETFDLPLYFRLFSWLGIYLAGVLAILMNLPGTPISIVAAPVMFAAPMAGLLQLGDYVWGPLAIVLLPYYPLSLLASLVLQTRFAYYCLLATLLGALTLSWIGLVWEPGWYFRTHNGFHELQPTSPLRNSP